MRYAILLYTVAAMLVFISCEPADAFTDYDVDFPTSDSKTDTHTLAITIDGCETRFNLKTEELEKFRFNDETKNEAIQIAIKRAKSGCKN